MEKTAGLLGVLVAVCALGGTQAVGAQAEAPRGACPELLPFNKALGALPPDFEAHDLTQVIQCATPPEKDEFETTEQFKARVAALNAPIPPTVAFAYVDLAEPTYPGVLGYVADAGHFEIKLTRRSGIMGSARNRDLVSLSRKLLSEDKSPASNAFGVTVEVTSRSYERLGIALPPNNDPRIFRSQFDVAWAFQVSMPPERARAMKDSIRLLLVCEPASATDGPLVVENMDASEATISNPTSFIESQKYLAVRSAELWVYDVTSGAVLLKAPLEPNLRPRR